ncbi:DNA polymerase III subunit gamma/tau [Mycoplasma hafezii]|uniref:DNA polymerase III subunit gamma/tau n=1 Tax=Mycoplasma hafezii TaxID=525886 RepID=UPI003CF9AA53
MSYKALYRKYRPTTFEQVVGQDHIITTLNNVVNSRKISHAYLFSGPKGTGKTSVAKIFANVLNCMHNENLAKACPKCLEKINSSVDVIELDAASNNGVDEIRDLKEKIEQTPLESRYKVYIIDEVHMLTKNAFNALLKTLEEPPKHAIFILATTDAHKIPVTILSRVQRFNFRRMTEKEIVQHLAWILKQEKVTYEVEALKSIARLSSGGMRDALSIVEQASVFQNGNITNEAILKNFGIVSYDEIIELVNKLIQKDAGFVIQEITKLKEEGIDPNQLIINLVTVIKEWILVYQSNDSKLADSLTVSQLKALKIGSLKQALKCSDAFYDILTTIQKTEMPFSLIELGLMKLMSNLDDKNVNSKPEYKIQEINKPISPVLKEPAQQKVEIVKEVEKPKPQYQSEVPQEKQTQPTMRELNFKLSPKEVVEKEQTETIEITKPEPKPVIKEKFTTQSSTIEIPLQTKKTPDVNELKTITTTIDTTKEINPIERKISLDRVHHKMTSDDYLNLSDTNPIFNDEKTVSHSDFDQKMENTNEFILFDNEQEGDRTDIDADLSNDSVEYETDNLINTKEIDLGFVSAIENEKDTEYLAKLFAKLFFDAQAWSRNKLWLYELKTVLRNLQISPNPEYKTVLKLLNGCEILGVNINYILIVADEEKVGQLNKNKTNIALQKFFKEVFGNYLNVFPITREEKEIIANYIIKWKSNGPQIIENFRGPEKLELKNSDLDPKIQQAYEIFGKDITIKKKG